MDGKAFGALKHDGSTVLRSGRRRPAPVCRDRRQDGRRLGVLPAQGKEHPGNPRRAQGAGEDILSAAKRELTEETGAVDYELRPVCVYSVTAPERNGGRETFGMLYTADVKSFDPVLTHEIGQIVIQDSLPAAWTYPDIQPLLIREVQRRTEEKEVKRRP